MLSIRVKAYAKKASIKKWPCAWQRYYSNQHGFTLIEILIAIGLFALLSALVFQTFNLQTRYHQELSSKQQRWADVVKAWQIIERDLSQLVARPVRDEFGDVQAALFYQESQGLAFTTLNWYASEISPTSQVQRVSYQYDANSKKLYREAWLFADSIPSTPKNRFVILDNVIGVNYVMSANDSSTHELWPLPSQPANLLPRMVVVKIITKDFGAISRYFYVPY